MEDNAMRAVMIAVSLFVVILTVSGIIAYINIAKDMATSADRTGLNEWDDINIYNVMDYNGDITINVTGMDLINFIRQYVKHNNIRMKLGQFTDSGDPSSYEDMYNWRNALGNASEEKLMNINPNAKLQMTKNIAYNGTVHVTVVGDIWIIKRAEPGVLYGDINSDGSINLVDYNRLNEYLSFEFTETEKKQADVNGDNVINEEDITLLRRYMANGDGILPNTGDLTEDGVIDTRDLVYMAKHVFTNIQREAADINLDRIVTQEDLDKLREMLIEKGIEVPIEE